MQRKVVENTNEILSPKYQGRDTRNNNIKRVNSLDTYKLSEERIKETIYKILSCFTIKTDEAIYDLFIEYENLIARNDSKLKQYFLENNKKCTFANFMEVIINIPLKEWLFWDLDNSYFKKILGDEIIIDGRRVNESIQEYLGPYEGLRNEEQNLIRAMIKELRQYKDDEKAQELYTLIRDNLVAKHGTFDFKLNRPQSNVWTDKEKVLFNNTLSEYEDDFPNTCNFFRKMAFDEISGPVTLEICNNCGIPLKYVGGELVCINDITCKHNLLVKDLKRRIIHVDKGEKVHVVKEGIAFFITRTGIEETLVYNKIKKVYAKLGWEVIKYPRQDSDGDILMKKDGIEILIDLKDYVNAKSLILELNNSVAQYRKKDIIYIPQYRKDSYESRGTMGIIRRELESPKFENKLGKTPVLAYKNTLIRTINKIIDNKMKEVILSVKR